VTNLGRTLTRERYALRLWVQLNAELELRVLRLETPSTEDIWIHFFGKQGPGMQGCIQISN